MTPERSTELLHKMFHGEQIAVICKDGYDAKTHARALLAKAETMWPGEIIETRARLERAGGSGTLEFVWLIANTNRRVDDFDVVEISRD